MCLAGWPVGGAAGLQLDSKTNSWAAYRVSRRLKTWKPSSRNHQERPALSSRRLTRGEVCGEPEGAFAEEGVAEAELAVQRVLAELDEVFGRADVEAQ